ncbi:bifunctional (p)ppGpp synthetase/guanosine-3',5'-bis(diphosphate) 3'-pyrophosphohydrolase [Candidatus Peregrinibacteria bacterium]|nr:bifunctional (p)ppGpp synthetase/guanosine-3',5'-bis(diphosphate) 3'-pyrophosphohydrolase [Candidatus Peregrinibacteria bacterium]MBI3815995.1 bifunctional (p)ppGpp synthetase/guanosine-3',5'-bis(diphosphate) 3'-pyrophosphohydrolase [Candidatus Peregrinibacteria bacterium]
MPSFPKSVREMANALGPKVREAYALANKVHAGEKRRSGEPYITHPVAVARMLFEAGADADIVCAALLHDTLEGNGASEQIRAEIYRKFGGQVLYLVEALSKDIRLEDKIEQQAVYIEQIQRALQVDIFVFFIKIADITHNMSTIHGLRRKRKLQWLHELRGQYLPLFSEYLHRIPLAHRALYHQMMDQIERLLTAHDGSRTPAEHAMLPPTHD